MTATLGTHNLHDEAGVPTFFADALLFTEAIPPTIRAAARAKWANATGRLSGFTIRRCRRQRDLVIALRRRLYKVTGTKYWQAHGGIAGVTPHRGTYAVETRERSGDQRRVVFIAEHRINAAFTPFVRGEGKFRARCWREHQALTLRIVEQYHREGWIVRAGGDLNTPREAVRGYAGILHEVGKHFDRLASSEPLHDVQTLGHKGSDHPRLKATT